MSNHVHLIISANENNVSNVLRDYKKFMSKRMVTAIQNNPGESRKGCLPDSSFRRECLKFLKSEENQTAEVATISR